MGQGAAGGDTAEKDGEKKETPGTAESEKAAHDQVHTEAHQAAHQAAQQEAAFKHFAENMNTSAEYLKNVGSFVAAALDPYGIDVQVDIQTPDGQKQTMSASSSSSSSSSSSTSSSMSSANNEEVKKAEDEKK